MKRPVMPLVERWLVGPWWETGLRRGRCRETTRHVRAGLATDRLRVHRFTADNVDELVTLDGDPRAMRFLPRALRGTRSPPGL